MYNIYFKFKKTGKELLRKGALYKKLQNKRQKNKEHCKNKER